MTPQLPGDETDDPKIGPAVNPPLPKLSPSSSSEQQNLRCPRCESTNTKFCYYNNYNLTQPRHFCKSCRRYWTQGGALRNVPVGGGCRKAKANGVTCGGVKSFGGAANKAKPLSRITLGVGSSSQFDYGFHSSPPSWTEPLNSNLRSLLRAATPSPVLNAGPNYTTDINPLRIKEEGPSMAADASLLINALNPRSFCMEPLETQQNQNSDLFFCETTAPGIHGLRQRQRSPAINWEDHSGMASGNVDYLSSHSDFLLSFPSESGATATRSSLEPNPVAGGGLCNAPFIWADTPNAAFP